MELDLEAAERRKKDGRCGRCGHTVLQQTIAATNELRWLQEFDVLTLFDSGCFSLYFCLAALCVRIKLWHPGKNFMVDHLAFLRVCHLVFVQVCGSSVRNQNLHNAVLLQWALGRTLSNAGQVRQLVSKTWEMSTGTWPGKVRQSVLAKFTS